MTQMNEQTSGGPDICTCPDCDYETEKERGTPCRSVTCPECGAKLVAKVEATEGAGGYSARKGEQIKGNLWRGSGGQFASGPSGEELANIGLEQPQSDALLKLLGGGKIGSEMSEKLRRLGLLSDVNKLTKYGKALAQALKDKDTKEAKRLLALAKPKGKGGGGGGGGEAAKLSAKLKAALKTLSGGGTVSQKMLDELKSRGLIKVKNGKATLTPKGKEALGEEETNEMNVDRIAHQAIETARALVNDSKMLAQVAEAKGVSPQRAANRMLDELERELAEVKMKTIAGKKRPASDFLVVEDPGKVNTWHLPVKVNGKIDHGLMGNAKAALTAKKGFRGNKYEGPDKAAALKKLKALYKSEDMEWAVSEAAMGEAYNDDEVYVSYAITSFADLQAAEQTNEAAERMRTLIYQFKELISNIMFSNEVEDKAKALRTLTDEFAELISGKIGDVEADSGMEEVFTESAADLALGAIEDFTGDFAELGIEAAIESGRRAPVLVDFRIIEPGPGNKRNNNYYPRPMLRECAPIFEGMDIFATDHLEAERNERTKVGRVQECPIRFTESGAPVGRVIIYDPGQAEKTRNRADAGELATMEGSIYASGIARAGKVDGVEYKVVEAITAGKYLELVSKAGAGGQALNLAEVNGGDEMKDEKKADEQADVEEVEIQEGDEQSVEGETPDTEPVEETSEPEYLSEAAVSTALDETNLPGAFKAALSKSAYADAEELGTAVAEAIAEVKALTGSGQVFGQGNTKPVEEKVLTADERELQSVLSFNETMRGAGCGEVPIPADLQYLIEGGK